MWQDTVLSIISITFTIALVPALYKREPPPLFSCVLTALGLTGIVICYATLGSLGWSAICTASTALCWWALAYMRLNKENHGFQG